MRMMKYLIPALIILGGCSSAPIEREPTINVVAVTNKLTLNLKGNALSSQQRQDVRTFIERKGTPYALRAKVVSHTKKGQAQASRIVNTLALQGMSLSNIEQAHIEQPKVGDIQIFVESFRAKVPKCQPQKYSNTFLNQFKTHPSFGCANQTALAQMVANPKDLIVGEELGPTNGAKAVSAIDSYIAPPSTNGAEDTQQTLPSAFGTN